MRIALILFFACLTLSVFAARTDKLTMLNGDEITGEIKGLSKGILTFKTDDAGTLSVKWTAVASIVSTNIFEVRTNSGDLFTGPLTVPTKSRMLAIQSDKGPVEITYKNVVIIHPFDKRFWGRLDGSVSLGMSFVNATEVFSLTGAFNSVYHVPKTSFNINANSVLSRTGSDSVFNKKQDLLLGNQYFFKRKWFSQVQAGVQQNTQLGIQLRIIAALAGGYKVVQSNTDLLTTAIGLAGNREYATDSDEARNNLEGLINISYERFVHITPKMKINTTLVVFPSLSDPGRVRVNYDLTASFELISDFTIALTFYDNFDNRPPSTSNAKNDYSVSVTFGYTW